jgi:hypothetical protein
MTVGVIIETAWRNPWRSMPSNCSAAKTGSGSAHGGHRRRRLAFSNQSGI